MWINLVYRMPPGTMLMSKRYAKLVLPLTWAVWERAQALTSCSTKNLSPPPYWRSTVELVLVLRVTVSWVPRVGVQEN